MAIYQKTWNQWIICNIKPSINLLCLCVVYNMLWLELNNSESQEISVESETPKTLKLEFNFSQLIYHRTMTYHSAIHKATFRLMKLDHFNPFKVIFANLFHTFIPALSGQKRPPSRSTHPFFFEQTKKRQVPCQCGLEAWHNLMETAVWRAMRLFLPLHRQALRDQVFLHCPGREWMLKRW